MKKGLKLLIFERVLLFLLVLLLCFAGNVAANGKDSDLDGIPDETDRYPFDYDNDGMPDIWENKHGLRYDLDDANGDFDGDGINNINEYKRGTNPTVSDKTQERVQPSPLSPLEVTMARVLIWAGIILFLLLIIGIIFYRVHILGVFEFMHHINKWRSERGKVMGPYRPMPIRRPVLRPHYRGIPPQPVVKTPPKQKVFIQQTSEVQLREIPTQEYREKVGEQAPVQVEKPQSAEEDKDVFGRLRSISVRR